MTGMQWLHDTLPATVAGTLFLLPQGTEFEGWRRVDDVYEHRTSWQEWRQMIVTDPDGAHYAIDYALGFTQAQEDEFPWEGTDTVKLAPVVAEQVTVTRYREVKPANRGKVITEPEWPTLDMIQAGELLLDQRGDAAFNDDLMHDTLADAGLPHTAAAVAYVLDHIEAYR